MRNLGNIKINIMKILKKILLLGAAVSVLSLTSCLTTGSTCCGTGGECCKAAEAPAKCCGTGGECCKTGADHKH